MITIEQYLLDSIVLVSKAWCYATRHSRDLRLVTVLKVLFEVKMQLGL